MEDIYNNYINELKSGDIQNHKSKDELLHLFWYFHPRYKFFKSVPLDSKLLDLGAGAGGLYYWKQWGEPKREDIELYAIDQKQGTLFEKYKDYQICDLDKEELKFDIGLFDAIIASHLIEHLEYPEKLLINISKLLKYGGKVYIELPTTQTMAYPKRNELLLMNIDVSISNFFDDNTHKKTYSLDELEELIDKIGFHITESGIIENSYLQNQLFTYGNTKNDQEITTYAIWSKFRWAQYLIAQK